MCHIMCRIMCRVMCRVMCCKSLIFTGGGRTHNVTQRTDTQIFTTKKIYTYTKYHPM